MAEQQPDLARNFAKLFGVTNERDYREVDSPFGKDFIEIKDLGFIDHHEQTTAVLNEKLQPYGISVTTTVSQGEARFEFVGVTEENISALNKAQGRTMLAVALKEAEIRYHEQEISAARKSMARLQENPPFSVEITESEQQFDELSDKKFINGDYKLSVDLKAGIETIGAKLTTELVETRKQLNDLRIMMDLNGNRDATDAEMGAFAIATAMVTEKNKQGQIVSVVNQDSFDQNDIDLLKDRPETLEQVREIARQLLADNGIQAGAKSDKDFIQANKGLKPFSETRKL